MIQYEVAAGRFLERMRNSDFDEDMLTFTIALYFCVRSRQF